ncbi:MAG: hypothetical protein ACLVKA_09750 [Collinsella aerofaciens]
MTDKFEGSVMPDNAAIAKGQDAVLDQINEIIAGINEDDRHMDCLHGSSAYVNRCGVALGAASSGRYV